jgi:hypothetical protein
LERVRMGRIFEGNAGDGSDAALITACVAFHAAFERERRARYVADEESDRLGEATEAAFGEIVGVAPATVAGLAAKASAALNRLVWQVAPLSSLPWRA